MGRGTIITTITLTAALLSSAGIAQTTAGANAQMQRPHEGRLAMPSAWFASMEGRQVNPHGAGEAYRWSIDARGRGVIALPSGPRHEYNDFRQHRFQLTPNDLRRFVALIDRFRATRQDEGPCMTDQAQDIVTWRARGRGADGMATHDHGCRAIANEARYAILAQAIGILRRAAVG